MSETWLSDDITDEALHCPGIPGFSAIIEPSEKTEEVDVWPALLKIEFT